ncbi:MAG TPA: hypothetical protein PKC66_17470, partial [Leptospiraceae bacterium]|nr:hypothetical protein [Leptospiraceae bacterium]HNC01104.1 hypothetical protein [Leptospiraceae bacterium]
MNQRPLAPQTAPVPKVSQTRLSPKNFFIQKVFYATTAIFFKLGVTGFEPATTCPPDCPRPQSLADSTFPKKLFYSKS